MKTATLFGRTVAVANEPECMTADELAAYLRVNRKTVYEYAARNVIPCRRLGRKLVFSRPAILVWLARQPAPVMMKHDEPTQRSSALALGGGSYARVEPSRGAHPRRRAKRSRPR